MNSPDRIYLDTASAAGFCSIAASTLAKFRVFGGGPPYSKIGRRVVYRAADLDAWMSAHRRANTSARVVLPIAGRDDR